MKKVAFAIACVLLVVVSACASEPSRDASGAIEEQGDLSVFSFQVGDCFDDPEGSPDEVQDVNAVPCSQAHDNEVFHIFELPDGPFPGDAAIASAAEEECLPAFASYVGTPYPVSELFSVPITPTSESWDLGDDREVVCALYDEGGELVGSMKGSNR